MWEINGDYPEARLTVGSDQQAGWCVEAPGVKPVHCELFWDGTALWVSDTARVGGIFLDGARVTEWVQIQGPAELRFGQAAMDVETSAPSAQRMLSKPGNARPVTVTDMVAAIGERPSRPLFGGAAGDESVPDLEAEKTRMQPAPSLDEVRTSIAIPNVPERPAPANDLRPRLGGANPSP
ncbi:MAG TPA: FHA domain-containing protein, partial [Polyangiaceae bacterium]|nr:FHA domain-containing protein [Polyangiaceae bacterium]